MGVSWQLPMASTNLIDNPLMTSLTPFSLSIKWWLLRIGTRLWQLCCNPKWVECSPCSTSTPVNSYLHMSSITFSKPFFSKALKTLLFSKKTLIYIMIRSKTIRRTVTCLSNNNNNNNKKKKKNNQTTILLSTNLCSQRTMTSQLTTLKKRLFTSRTPNVMKCSSCWTKTTGYAKDVTGWPLGPTLTQWFYVSSSCLPSTWLFPLMIRPPVEILLNNNKCSNCLTILIGSIRLYSCWNVYSKYFLEDLYGNQTLTWGTAGTN